MIEKRVREMMISAALTLTLVVASHSAKAGFFDDLKKSVQEVGDGLEDVGNEIQRTLEGEGTQDSNTAPSASPNERAPAQAAPDILNRDREKVRAAQRMLNRLGYDAGESDGLYGKRTRREIIKFQNASGLSPTGNVTASLLEELEAQNRNVGSARVETPPDAEPATGAEPPAVSEPPVSEPKSLGDDATILAVYPGATNLRFADLYQAIYAGDFGYLDSQDPTASKTKHLYWSYLRHSSLTAQECGRGGIASRLDYPIFSPQGEYLENDKIGLKIPSRLASMYVQTRALGRNLHKPDNLQGFAAKSDVYALDNSVATFVSDVGCEEFVLTTFEPNLLDYVALRLDKSRPASRTAFQKRKYPEQYADTRTDPDPSPGTLGKLILSSQGNASVPAFDLYYKEIDVILTRPTSGRIVTSQKLDLFSVVHDAGPDDVIVPFVSKTVEGATHIRYSDDFISLVREEIAPAIQKVKPPTPTGMRPGERYDHSFTLSHFIKGHTELPSFTFDHGYRVIIDNPNDLIRTTAFVSRQGRAFQTKEEWESNASTFSGQTNHYFPSYVSLRRNDFALSQYLHGVWNSDTSLRADPLKPVIDSYSTAQAARAGNAQR